MCTGSCGTPSTTNRPAVTKGRLAASRPAAFFLHYALHTIMQYTTFTEYVAQRDEGLLTPARAPLKGMARLNLTPFTNARRKRLQTKPPKKPTPFAPTVHKVAEIVPDKFVAKLKTPAPHPHSAVDTTADAEGYLLRLFHARCSN